MGHTVPMPKRKRVIRAPKDADSQGLGPSPEIQEYLHTVKFLDRKTGEYLLELLEEPEYEQA